MFLRRKNSNYRYRIVPQEELVSSPPARKKQLENRKMASNPHVRSIFPIFGQFFLIFSRGGRSQNFPICSYFGPEFWAPECTYRAVSSTLHHRRQKLIQYSTGVWKCPRSVLPDTSPRFWTNWSTVSCSIGLLAQPAESLLVPPLDRTWSTPNQVKTTLDVESHTEQISQ